MKFVVRKSGEQAIVDDDDDERVMAHRWYRQSTGYAPSVRAGCGLKRENA